MAAYLYAVQTDEGREVMAWTGDVDKVGDDTALSLHRWPADGKLALPISHPVTAA
jgi:hypothetical protein